MQRFIIFIIMLSWQCQRLQCIIQLDDSPDQSELQQKLLQLLARIRFERNYDTLLLYGGTDTCVYHEVLQQLDLPFVLLQQGSTYDGWEFNQESLLLCCDSQAEQEKNNRTMLKLQSARRLVYLEEQVQPEQLCEIYFAREQYNVAMLDVNSNVYSCRLFQQDKNYVQIILEQINSSSIYVQQFRNMMGAPIKTETDQLTPRTMLYRDPITNKTKMLGYVANVINTFVERVNATLQLREDYVFGKVTFYGAIEQWTIDNQLDVGASLGTTLRSYNMDYISHPYVSTSVCCMVPLPKPLPYKVLYMYIVDPLVLGIIFVLFLIFSLLIIYSWDMNWRKLTVINLLMNDRCFRGLLGQAFPLPDNPGRHLKAICLLLIFASLMTTTMYECYLQSLFTHPPTEPTVKSFQDVRESRFRFAVDRNEATLLLKSHNLTLKNTKNAYVTKDFDEFVQLRDSFNASFIYPVSRARFRTYAEQQKLFQQPVFYFNQNLCLNRFVVLCFPIRRHLPYRQLFNEHILAMHEFGMGLFWVDRSFRDMLKVGLATFKDFSEPKPIEDALFLRDLTLIFQVYLAANLIACICFGIECYWGRYRRSKLLPVDRR